MAKLVSSLYLLLCSFQVYAQNGPQDVAPAETNTTGIITFGVLFFGMCIGFVWYMWYNEKKKGQDQKPE